MIDIKKITNGEMNDVKVWICDLRYTDYSNKPIRNIKPIEVLVRSNSETSKRVYYSESHFVEFNKKGEPLKSKIKAPFDGTGYRSYAGVSLNCFDNEKECVNHYKKQVKIAIKGLEEHRECIAEVVNKKITELKELS
jgi:hypothetical protein